MITITVVVITATSAIPVAGLAVSFRILLLLLQAAYDLVKGGLSELIGLQRLVLIKSFDPRLHLFPSISCTDRGIETLDPGTQ